MVRAIPDGYYTVTPSFTFKNSKKAIEFYQKAFSAELIDMFPNMTGDGIMHATLKIGNSIIMMGDEMMGSPDSPKSPETTGQCPISLYLYVPDVDKLYHQAVAAGGISTMELNDAFWGDRVGSIKDPFGYIWMIASHKNDYTKDEIRDNAEKFFEEMAKK